MWGLAEDFPSSNSFDKMLGMTLLMGQWREERVCCNSAWEGRVMNPSFFLLFIWLLDHGLREHRGMIGLGTNRPTQTFFD